MQKDCIVQGNQSNWMQEKPPDPQEWNICISGKERMVWSIHTYYSQTVI